MRAQIKNRRAFWYANAGKAEELKDSDGYFTGEWSSVYGDPVKEFANISANHGNAYEEQFGTMLDYDKVIATCKDFGITEKTHLWVDTAYDADKKNPHDYIVKKIAKSINSYLIAIKKVDVS